MKSLVALFVLGLAASTSALIDVGKCPNYANMATFDLASYTGRWYEIERFEDFFEAESTCTTADYTTINATSVSVVNAGTTIDGTPITTSGILSTGSVPGELVASFIGDEKVSYYIVLDTDYTSYSCVYFCSELLEYRQQFAWIMSRDTSLDATTLANAREVFTRNGIEVDLFNTVEQGSDCTYVSAP